MSYWGSGPDRHGKDAKRVQVRLSADEHGELMTIAKQHGKKVKRYDWRTGKSVEEVVPMTMSEVIRQALTDYVAARKTESMLEKKAKAPKRKAAPKTKAGSK